MRTSVRIGIGFALVWIILKLTAFNFRIFLNDLRPFIFANMLFVTTAISLTLYLKNKSLKDTNLMDDVKSGMISGVLYTVIVSGFIYFYYQSIYPEFNSSKISAMELRLEDEEQIQEFRKTNPDMENNTSEEIRNKVLTSLSQYYSSQFAMTVSLLGMLIYATLNSLVLSLVFRKLFFKNHSDNSAPKVS